MKGYAEVYPIFIQEINFLVGCLADDSATLAARCYQAGGLVTDFLIVALNGKINPAGSHHLHDRTLAHSRYCIRKEVVNAILIDVGNQACCFRKVVVPQQDSDVIAP